MRKFKLDFIKSATRKDGTKVTVVQTEGDLKIPKDKYKYYIYISYTNGKTIEYDISSENNYFAMKSKEVVDELLSDVNLNFAIRNNGMIK